jgi:5-methylcytosine-specific restriction endonuclease McrA
VSRGGHTSLENLVTACYPCNFGKDNYTLDQLNLQSPFSSPPIESEHDGFVSLLAD